MALNALVDSFCHNQKQCGTERVNTNAVYKQEVGRKQKKKKGRKDEGKDKPAVYVNPPPRQRDLLDPPLVRVCLPCVKRECSPIADNISIISLMMKHWQEATDGGQYIRPTTESI